MIVQIISRLRHASEAVNDLPEAWQRRLARDAFKVSIHHVFYFSAAAALVVFLASLPVRCTEGPPKARLTKGILERYQTRSCRTRTTTSLQLRLRGSPAWSSTRAVTTHVQGRDISIEIRIADCIERRTF